MITEEGCKDSLGPGVQNIIGVFILIESFEHPHLIDLSLLTAKEDILCQHF